MINIKIHDGPSQHCKLLREIVVIGSLSQAVAGAKVICGQMLRTKGKRVFVAFDADDKGAPITSRILQEGLL